MAEQPASDRTQASSDVDASLEGGNYEVIKQRLTQHGRDLLARTDALNANRTQVFGGSELAVIANERVRTENNCVPRDIVNVNELLLFGYNVFIGLKKETTLNDVMALHRFEPTESGFDCGPVPIDSAGGFLTSPEFTTAFNTVYRYYRDAKLLQLVRTDTSLMAAFQVGSMYTDIKVFRWRIEGDGRITYVDDRGGPDYVRPPPHDFEWTELGREDQIAGEFPHINIVDTLFVSTMGGFLTVKVENNTHTGEGVYKEHVDDGNQTLDDGAFFYAKLGGLILLKVKPFREDAFRYLVYNERTHKIVRIDAIGKACRQLPEDHGIVFPGGYYLQAGSYKLFEGDVDGLDYERTIKSPNGEDVLYVFHRREDGHYALFAYNLIRKAVDTPIHCHGYSLFADGRLVVFRSVSDEPTRVHPMQVWKTPFTSAEFAAAAPTDDSYLSRVGNAELVRGISDAYAVTRLIAADDPNRQTFEDISATCSRLIDGYYWLGHAEVGDLKSIVDTTRRTVELIVDEFEKIVAFRNQATAALQDAERQIIELDQKLRSESWNGVTPFLDALTTLREHRGHIITLREVRYIDDARLDELEKHLVDHFDRISRDAVTFLLRDEAFRPLQDQLDSTLAQLDKVNKVADATPLRAQVEKTALGLDLLNEVVGNLQIDDATKRTTILEGISEVFAHTNRVRATIDARYRELLTREGKAEFGAQFKLLGQSVASALSMSDSPQRCDEELARIMIQLEELEGRFSEFDEFLGDLAAKREEIYEAFGGRKQTLLDERSRRAQNIIKAADGILEGVGRRARTLGTADSVNGYFASDSMVMKLRQLGDQLAELGDTVKSEEILAKLKTAKQEALRGLRDRLELFEDGENIIKFGKHRFTVNAQALELTMVLRDNGMALHLGGTDFYELIDNEAFAATKRFWEQDLVSESPSVYRGEYLAASLLFDAESGRDGLSIQTLLDDTRTEQGLTVRVREYAQDRYDQGYDRGVHDADATLILEKVLSMRETVGLLRFAPVPRTLAVWFWVWYPDEQAKQRWHRQARSLGRIRKLFRDNDALLEMARDLGEHIARFFSDHALPTLEGVGDIDKDVFGLAGSYLVEELQADALRFDASADALELRESLLRDLETHGMRAGLDEDLQALERDMAEQLSCAYAWVQGFVDAKKLHLQHAVFEAAVLLTDRGLDREPVSAVTSVDVKGLLGRHLRITDRTLSLRIDEFLLRLAGFANERVPAYRAYRTLRTELLGHERERLRLGEFMPKVMTSFVRNKLINDVYLPLVGDNLAKQIGAAGDKKRTDLMGLLLLISPPGYGKTTLMEYIANRLGLVFVKVNGPALGHSVHSLDPAEAPNATARQEVEKINLGFEMGNNVMLYLDDIQHTHPELLQKFISLCDAQRRIEGVWKGRTRTYDMRGKKFCVVMAGNPYTESGESFQIPDMLSNRADVYNLGDVLHGKEDLFALSYIENSLTSNATLAPLAGREQADVYKLVRMAKGEQVATSELSHGYSSTELDDILAVFRHVFRCQDVLLKVNQGYIRSAAQDDKFRTQPPFKLQGSYRNMNKLAEKVVSAMTEGEVNALINDHYQGEAQTLTTEAEQNLLMLKDGEDLQRWNTIKHEYQRLKRMGGSEDDPVTRLTGTLTGLMEELEGIKVAVGEASNNRSLDEQLISMNSQLGGIREVLAADTNVSTDNHLAQISSQMTGINDTLAAGSSGNLDEYIASVSSQLFSIREALEAGATNGFKEQMGALVSELREIRGVAGEAIAPSTKKTDELWFPLNQVLNALEKLARPQIEVPAQVQTALDRLAHVLEQFEPR